MEANVLDSIKETLEAELAAIEGQLSEYGDKTGEYAVPVDEDEGFADSAHATTERAERLSLVEQLIATRNDIVGALKRIEEGTYGQCENCGQPISPERLEALPTVRLCLDCKKQTNS